MGDAKLRQDTRKPAEVTHLTQAPQDVSAFWIRVREAEDAVEGRARGRLVFVSENGKGVDLVADEVDLVPVQKTVM